MAWKREVVGSFMKSKDESKPPYLKFRRAIAMKEGEMLRVEGKNFQMRSLETAIAAGKIKPEQAEKARERIEKMPDFVIGELVLLTNNE